MRYFIEISYHGQAYHGWQIQPNAHSVQAEIESAIKQLTGTKYDIVGSGRTDRGVHAQQQFFHLDLPEVSSLGTLKKQLNGILPEDIAVIDIYQVQEGAHARFDASSRSYEYHICHVKNPFLRDRSYYMTRKPGLHPMTKACEMLLGQTDFECFSKTRTAVNNFDCQLSVAKWEYAHNDLLVFYVSANRFLRGMVRAMVGTLLEVGFEKIDLGQFQQILESKDRSAAGPSVPACGLFLTAVRYPQSIFNT